MNVLLTGATGLLGSELAVRLARRAEVTGLHCLVRARGGRSGRERLRAAFEFHGDTFPASRVTAVEGELSDAGLPAALASEPALRSTEVIVNAAANTSFLAQNAALIEAANVTGLERLLVWARTLPRLETFLQISTAAICGADKVGRVVMEDESPDAQSPQLVAYTRSKLRAELLLRDALAAEVLLVARPSILVGDSRGLAPRSNTILWALAAMNRLRLLPAPALGRLDMLPVDVAAEAITRLLFARRRHRVYHVSSGPAASTSVVELAELLARHSPSLPSFELVGSEPRRALTRWARTGQGRDFAQYERYRRAWQEDFGDAGRAATLMQALEPYFRFMELGQTFDNARLMADADDVAAEPAHRYLESNMGYLAAIDVLGGAQDP